MGNNNLISTDGRDTLIKFRTILLMENFENKLVVTEKSLSNIRGYL